MVVRGGRRSGAGRPRKSGAREPNGRLVRREPPNPIVARARAYLCPDPKLATSPLDVAFGRGWLSAEAHQAGRRFASLCWRAGLLSKSASLRGGSALSQLERTDGDVDRIAFANMEHSEIAALWDATFDTPEPVDGEVRVERAVQALAAMTTGLTSGERRLLFDLCALETWPQWVFVLVAVERGELSAQSGRDAVRERDRVVTLLNRLARRKLAA